MILNEVKELRPCVTINTNSKSCVGSPNAPSHFTLSKLERSKSFALWSLVSYKTDESDQMLLLNADRKSYKVKVKANVS